MAVPRVGLTGGYALLPEHLAGHVVRDRLGDEGMGVRVHCLARGGVDLTSAAGKMTMGVLAAVAEFERDLLIERTKSGLARAKAQGKTLGRPQALSSDQRKDVLQRLAAGDAVAAVARALKTSRATIMRTRGAAAA